MASAARDAPDIPAILPCDSDSDSDDWFSKDLADFVLEPRLTPPSTTCDSEPIVSAQPLQFASDAAADLPPFLPPQFSGSPSPSHQHPSSAIPQPAEHHFRPFRHQQLQLLHDQHADQLPTLATHLLPTRSGFAEALRLGGGSGDGTGPEAAQRMHTAINLLSRLFATHAFRSHQLHLLGALRAAAGTQPHPLWSHLVALIRRTPVGQSAAGAVRLVSSVIREVCACSRNVRCTLERALLAPAEATALLAAIAQAGYAAELVSAAELRWLEPAEEDEHDAAAAPDWIHGPPGLQRVAGAELMGPRPAAAAALCVNHLVANRRDYLAMHGQMLAQDFWQQVRAGLQQMRQGGDSGCAEFWDYGVRRIVLRDMGRGLRGLAVQLPAAERMGGGGGVAMGKEAAGDRGLADAGSVGASLMVGSLAVFAPTRAFAELLLAVVLELHDDEWVTIQPLGTVNATTAFLNRPLLMLQSRTFFQHNQSVYRALGTINAHTLPALYAPLVCNYHDNSAPAASASSSPGQPPAPPLPPAYLSATAHYESNARDQSADGVRLPLPLAANAVWPAPAALGYNGAQTSAIRLALTSRVALIQGPPGTGKSFVGRELVELLLHNRTERLLIVSYTNQALDQLLLAVLPVAAGQLVRLGAGCTEARLESVLLRQISAGIRTGSGLMHTNCWNAANDIGDHTCVVAAALADSGQAVVDVERKLAALQAAHDRLDELRQLADFEQLRDRRVIGMTSSFAARNQTLLRLLQAPIVLVEEAAELIESHVLASLTADTQHLILIGDPQQLRPTVQSPHLRSGLDISLFERLQKSASAYGSAVSCVRLDEQHRMRPPLADLLRPHFYPHLRDAAQPAAAGADDSVPAMPGPVQFIDHRWPERWHGTSFGNAGEARMVRSLCAHLIRGGCRSADIAVLCTYRAQVALLATTGAGSREARCHGARVSVLDGFQGCESRIVLLSLVRNNERGGIGFLAEQNRVCVALSRAREALYIFGNMPHLIAASEESVWRSVADRMLAANVWRPADIGVLRAICTRHRREMRIETESDWNLFEKSCCICTQKSNK